MAQLETHNGVYIWKYLPSFVAGVVFACLFAIFTLVHCWRMNGKGAKFCFWFVLGGLCESFASNPLSRELLANPLLVETGGFALRAVAHHHSGWIWPYVVQTLLILLAPSLLAASVYASLKKVIFNLKAKEMSLLPLRCTTGTFVSGDILSFFIQAVAGSMLSSTKGTESTRSTGKTLMIIGLLVQVIFLSGFIVATAVFHRRWTRVHSSRDLSKGHRHWIRLLYSLYTVGFLIFVRSVFRVVEYVEGTDGYLLAHEWPIYALDGGPMILAMIVFAIWHPIPRQERDYLSISSTQSSHLLGNRV
ncbi:unnamed protein product [Penicillium salamii]|uniref:RTA-like protein n=1 Tax=Penicillium salamii TaxID=1612424 RepID=A0A9W4JUQ4_9EURO|nr:unnamed protein product [Penicillium salamii]CAG8191443.1 unnamed protein product [Penicillium salamii]CAG8249617.1 unnamed protein product [Penicillium salamii]CAG8278773.1 unnamed protein product [Penicillium salamii]CAG8310277.1 unnamed protein product [Penicillium salamii]